MSLRTADYDYQLPPELVAQYPAAQRDSSRLMLVDRVRNSFSHYHFRDLPALLDPGDLLVLNNTRVLPARLRFEDRKAELLLLNRIGPRRWECMVRPGRYFRKDRVFVERRFAGTVQEIRSDGIRVIEFSCELDLEEIGELALPPYVARGMEQVDQDRYQTVYGSVTGAIAAPTAGLHLTREILARLSHAFVTLHVGPGTFLPVKEENLRDHRMHAEQFTISAEAASQINAAANVIAVGTTTVRVLETSFARHQKILAEQGATDIFIYPPFRFGCVRKLITNFHLPKSTLLMLVSAFAGRELVLRAYQNAIEHRYRFYSYGDAMLII